MKRIHKRLTFVLAYRDTVSRIANPGVAFRLHAGGIETSLSSVMEYMIVRLVHRGPRKDRGKSPHISQLRNAIGSYSD